MKKTLTLLTLALLFVIAAKAQVKYDRSKDSIVMKDIYQPMVQDAEDNGQEPDWDSFRTTLTARYDAAFAERLVWKGKIYYYYGRDWPTFTAALVHYTDTYEDKANLKLMDKNANMILKFSTDPKELSAALGWSNITIDKEPGNADYQKTYTALKAKVNGN